MLSVIIGDASVKKKKTFSTTSRSNGCVLEIKTQSSKGKPAKLSTTRFILASFNNNASVMSLLTQNGLIFIFDLDSSLFWQLSSLGCCSFIQFSLLELNQLIVCDENNDILFVQVDDDFVVRHLKGYHLHPVKSMSFSSDTTFLMTSSLYETVIWNLETNQVKHKLSLGKRTAIKIITFLPHSKDIIACFQDDSLIVWSFPTFDVLYDCVPNDWKGHHLKAIAFSSGSQVMAVGGVDSHVTLFHMETWNPLKRVPLPVQISHVKYLTFLEQNILILLTASGELYFLDIERNCLVPSQFCSSNISSPIYNLAVSQNARYIVCSLFSGEVLLFRMDLLLCSKPRTAVQWKSALNKRQIRKQLGLQMIEMNQKLCSALDIERLRPLLKYFGEYPTKFRTLIWKAILKIPENREAYGVLASVLNPSVCKRIDQKYPLQNKSILNTLKRLLSSLSSWSPLFSSVTYLPEFVFPFVSLLRNDPCVLFEIIASIVMNHCQNWFQCFPLPPINVLAMTENVLGERDPPLLEHYEAAGITSNVYAWLLLQSAFSEVFNKDQWPVLWDHVISNGSWFLLHLVVAYNILSRQVLLSLGDVESFETFFHSQSSVDVQKVVCLAYNIDASLTDHVHPKQYYRSFTRLRVGPLYQTFEDTPNMIKDMRRSGFNNVTD